MTNGHSIFDAMKSPFVFALIMSMPLVAITGCTKTTSAADSQAVTFQLVTGPYGYTCFAMFVGTAAVSGNCIVTPSQ